MSKEWIINIQVKYIWNMKTPSKADQHSHRSHDFHGHARPWEPGLGFSVWCSLPSQLQPFRILSILELE